MKDNFVQILTGVVRRGKYLPEEMLDKLRVLWVSGAITEEQKEELEELCEQCADPAYVRARTIEERLDALERDSLDNMLAIAELYETLLEGETENG